MCAFKDGIHILDWLWYISLLQQALTNKQSKNKLKKPILNIKQT
jgi:hypothetical protein